MKDKTIRYRITTGAGLKFITTVHAETLNDGFVLATVKALEFVNAITGNEPSDNELNSVEFWEVVE